MAVTDQQFNALKAEFADFRRDARRIIKRLLVMIESHQVSGVWPEEIKQETTQRRQESPDE